MHAFRILTCIVALLLFSSCAPPQEEIATLSGQTMGTDYSVQLAGCESKDCQKDIGALIHARLLELNQQLSHFDAQSELSRFNAQTEHDWFPVSQDLASVVDLALKLSLQTDGFFDITTAPAVALWGFASEDLSIAQAPEAPQLSAARKLIDHTHVEARLSPPALRKQVSDLALNLSAIAKGYAADQLAYLLQSEGHANFIVDIGGELRLAGQRPNGTAWRIGIEPPESELGINYIVTPGENGVATSGDYRNYYWLEGRRVSHLIDPRTASPTTSSIASVTVIAPSAAQADALATALSVMQSEAALAYIQKQQLTTLLFVREENNFRTHVSPSFERLLLKN